MIQIVIKNDALTLTAGCDRIPWPLLNTTNSSGLVEFWSVLFWIVLGTICCRNNTGINNSNGSDCALSDHCGHIKCFSFYNYHEKLMSIKKYCHSYQPRTISYFDVFRGKWFQSMFFFIYAVDENINQLRNVEKKITSFYLVISKVFYLTGWDT